MADVHRGSLAEPSAGRSTFRAVRLMTVAYALVIVAGIALYLVVGLEHR
jgi:hypothetical protein